MRPLYWLLGLQDGQVVAQILEDELVELIEADVVVSVGVQRSENFSQIFSFRLESDEEAGFFDQSDEVIEADSVVFPEAAVVAAVVSSEKQFSKVAEHNDREEFRVLN